MKNLEIDVLLVRGRWMICLLFMAFSSALSAENVSSVKKSGITFDSNMLAFLITVFVGVMFVVVILRMMAAERKRKAKRTAHKAHILTHRRRVHSSV